VSYASVALAMITLLVGFAAGMLTFKRSNRWCPTCGNPLICKANCCGRADAPRPLGVGLGASRNNIDPRTDTRIDQRIDTRGVRALGRDQGTSAPLNNTQMPRPTRRNTAEGAPRRLAR
jgi:hypothetical protein